MVFPKKKMERLRSGLAPRRSGRVFRSSPPRGLAWKLQLQKQVQVQASPIKSAEYRRLKLSNLSPVQASKSLQVLQVVPGTSCLLSAGCGLNLAPSTALRRDPQPTPSFDVDFASNAIGSNTGHTPLMAPFETEKLPHPGDPSQCKSANMSYSEMFKMDKWMTDVSPRSQDNQDSWMLSFQDMFSPRLNISDDVSMNSSSPKNPPTSSKRPAQPSPLPVLKRRCDVKAKKQRSTTVAPQNTDELLQRGGKPMAAILRLANKRANELQALADSSTRPAKDNGKQKKKKRPRKQASKARKRDLQTGTTSKARVSSKDKSKEKLDLETLGQRACSCKKNRCLKLYCECFAASLLCTRGKCICNDCQNTKANGEKRQKAIQSVLARNKKAFSDKRPNRKQRRAALLQPDGKDARSGKGCKCEKTRCLKKYCECFFTKSHCTDLCICIGCENPHREDTK